MHDRRLEVGVSFDPARAISPPAASCRSPTALSLGACAPGRGADAAGCRRKNSADHPAINLKTAKTLGLTVPDKLLVATEVIE
jgi:hypothetical protein